MRLRSLDCQLESRLLDKLGRLLTHCSCCNPSTGLRVSRVSELAFHIACHRFSTNLSVVSSKQKKISYDRSTQRAAEQEYRQHTGFTSLPQPRLLADVGTSYFQLVLARLERFQHARARHSSIQRSLVSAARDHCQRTYSPLRAL